MAALLAAPAYGRVPVQTGFRQRPGCGIHRSGEVDAAGCAHAVAEDDGDGRQQALGVEDHEDGRVERQSDLPEREMDPLGAAHRLGAVLPGLSSPYSASHWSMRLSSARDGWWLHWARAAQPKKQKTAWAGQASTCHIRRPSASGSFSPGGPSGYSFSSGSRPDCVQTPGGSADGLRQHFGGFRQVKAVHPPNGRQSRQQHGG
jgi:hypothetical protein